MSSDSTDAVGRASPEVVGVLGGGQLGKMLAMAAVRRLVDSDGVHSVPECTMCVSWWVRARAGRGGGHIRKLKTRI